MEKNWLIRTKSNHILGPVSKDKVLELYQNGSIKPDDEVCCGNGFWFFVREEDMVARFLLGKEVQNFNPISEAKDVLTSPSQSYDQVQEEDITKIGGINASLLNHNDKTPPPTVMSALYEKEGITPPVSASKPAASQPEPVTQITTSPSAPKKKTSSVRSGKSKATVRAPLQKQNFLQYIAILCFLILFLLIYYRRTIIRQLFSGEVTLSSFVISSAYAQEDIPGKKKSSLSAQSF